MTLQFDADGALLESLAAGAGGHVVEPNRHMRKRVREFDWSATPLGPREDWPPELRISVEQMLDSSFPKAIAWGKQLTTIYNDAFLPILGKKPEALGCSFADVWSEVWEDVGPIAERAFAGVPTYIEDMPLVIDRSGKTERAWFTFCYSPLRLANGEVAGMLDTVMETTDKVRAQAQLALVNQELGHRLKNSLTLVQAIASQTLAPVTDPRIFSNFCERLMALGQAHDAILRHNWSWASLGEIIREAVRPHDSARRVEMQGADLRICSRAAVGLSLMVHELATNAVKYGALSVSRGRVRLWWQTVDKQFSLHWQEEGGPPVVEPDGEGFGSRLIDMGLGNGSRATRRYDPKGFRFDIEAPLSELVV